MSEETINLHEEGGHLATQYLTFSIADETYAVEILQVKEILRYETVTTVPSTPRHIRGVLNLRGNVVPVVDLAVRFGLPASTISKWTCVIIVETATDDQPTDMGILVDAVSQVLDLRPGDIEPPPAFGAQVRVDYLLGLTRDDKRFTLIIDMDKALAAEELISQDQLRQAIAAAETDQPAAPPDQPPATETVEASETVEATDGREEDPDPAAAAAPNGTAQAAPEPPPEASAGSEKRET